MLTRYITYFNHVSQPSGHLKSLDHYSKASDVQQKKMSNLTSTVPPAPSAVINSAVRSRQNTNFVSASFNALPGYKFQGTV